MAVRGNENLSRRAFLAGSTLGAAAAAVGLAGGCASSAEPSTSPQRPMTATGAGRPPNILFVFSDQQRWDTLGCCGQELPVSPNLDRLASEGVRFEQVFTCQPVCGPARACLQTGRYSTDIGCYRNDRPLPLEEKTIAHWLSEAGYEVGCIGKWHLAANAPAELNLPKSAVLPEARGGYKDLWLGVNLLEATSHSYGGYLLDANNRKVELPDGGYRVDWMTDLAIRHLRDRRSDRPFFLFISYLEPHHQNDHKHFEGPPGSKERFANFKVPGDLEGTGGDWREEYPDYLGCCQSLDYNVGRLRRTLEELGQWENTLLVYTTDHGCHFRTRNAEYKRSCHDSSIHIPMILHGPGFTGGRVVKDLVSLIDLPPTFLASAGQTPPATMRGRALQPLAQGKAVNWPEDVFVQISVNVGRAIRTSRWTYSICAPGDGTSTAKTSKHYVEEYLYDLAKDPHQRHNLVRDPAYANVREELAIRMKRCLAESGEADPVILPPQGELHEEL